MLRFCLLLSIFKLSKDTILHASLHALKAKAIFLHCASDHILLSLFLKNTSKIHFYFRLCWVRTLPSCGEQWLLLFGPWALERGSRSGGARAYCPQHAGSFQSRDGTRVPYTSVWILIHCTARDVPSFYFKLHRSLGR